MCLFDGAASGLTYTITVPKYLYACTSCKILDMNSAWFEVNIRFPKIYVDFFGFRRI